MSQKENSFFFSLPSKPQSVSLDPRNWFLKKLKFRKPKEMLLYQLKRDENSMERIRAASELVDFKTKDVIDALSFSIDSDRFWGVQLEVAKNLGKMGTEEALEALLGKKDHKDHRVRRGVAIGLRHFAKLENGDRAITALINYLNTDVSYYVRAYSAHSLGFYTNSEEAFTALTEALNQNSVNDQIRYRAFLGFAELKNPKALPLAEDYLKAGKEYQGQTGAAYAIGKMGKGDAGALRALLSARSLHDIRVRAESATSIAFLEVPSAIPELEEWLRDETAGTVRRRLRETIDRLKQSAEQNGQEETRREIKTLEERTKSLEDTLSKLESKHV